MDHQAELRGFLTTRRARISPEEAGMTPFPGIRRVPGMRREEVAYLAGISVDYYTRLERGRVAGISDEVLDAVSRALRLDNVEHDHLFALVRALRPADARTARPTRRAVTEPDVLLQRVLDAIDAPAAVQNARLDIVAANRLGWALYPHAEQWLARGEGKPFNHLRFQLLDPRAQDFYQDWELAVRNSVAVLREAAGRDRADEELFALIGELSAKSKLFRTLWASHDVLRYRRGPKRYRHPLVGELVFESQTFAVGGAEELSLVVYTVEPGSPTADALEILGTWLAEHGSAETPSAAPRGD
ncbi:helix-turn-helix domain-containing protein [Streptomyces millisiae]|uniref:Helix-turn-helix domain-containing protein n=1 Tax=Streptomyces millisiae TaxID=3075542 RepID=A0ABU2LKU2_9ACTN|nr:helix-turn-helix domain-containing protein [Streptomyces sp. DSM 44918]MDT0317862.1 helix-turn-helix domain-containing protein [Streptomyces sp. DSM 44918]